MSKRQRNTPRRPAPEERPGPWLARRSGLLLVAAISLAFGLYMYFRLSDSFATGERLLYSLGGSASIWVAFGLMYLFNITVRGRE